jgi:hypothetical protein
MLSWVRHPRLTPNATPGPVMQKQTEPGVSFYHALCSRFLLGQRTTVTRPDSLVALTQHGQHII